MKKIALIATLLALYWHQAFAQNDTTRTGVGENLGEIVITGTRSETDIRHLPMTVSVVGRQIIEKDNGTSLLPALTRHVPGLFITSRGIMGYGVSGGAAGGMSLRGISGGSGRIMVLIDGHPQYMGIMGHPISDAYQPFLADKVEVLRGPASVLYGSNAMGGVINIVTRKMQEDGVKTNFNLGYGSYNSLQTEISNRVHKGRFTSVVGGSYNRTDGHRENMEFEQYGGYVKMGYELSGNWNLWADMNLTHFNASQPGSLAEPLEDADQNITRGMASVALRNNYGNTSGTLSFFHNWGRHKINDGYNESEGESPLPFRFNSKDRMTGVSLYQSASFFAGNSITLGADWFGFGGEAWNKFVEGEREGESTSIVDKDEHEVAAYIDVRQNIAHWLTLNAGLRVDNHSMAGTEVVPQFGAAFHFPGEVEVKLSANKGFRYPLIREMFMWGAANPNLEAERMWNYEAAFSHKPGDGRFSYGINLFHIKGDNMIVTTAVDGKMMNLNTGKIVNTGVEGEFSCRVSAPLSIYANYSWLHMEYPVAGAPEHKFHIGGNFRKGRWDIVTGMQYVADLYLSSSDEDTESFFLWDAKCGYGAADGIDIWVKCENILDTDYQTMLGYPMPGATFMFGVGVSF